MRVVTGETTVMGPLLMFDKSFLQILSPDEVSELSMYFKFVGTSLLIRDSSLGCLGMTETLTSWPTS